MEDSNWIDSIIYLLLAISTLWGMWRGLWESMFGILTLVAALIVGRDFGPLLVPSLYPLLGESPLVPWIASLLVFLIVFLLLGVVARLLTAMLQKNDMGGINLIGGAAFGALRGGIFGVMLVLMLSALGVPKTDAWKQSVTVPLFGQVLYTAVGMPFVADYRGWLKFDRQGRPLLRDGRKFTGKKADDASGDEEGSATDEIMSLKSERDKEYLSVMEELSDVVAVRSGYTPSADTVYHGEDEEESGVQRLLAKLMCALQDDCAPAKEE